MLRFTLIAAAAPLLAAPSSEFFETKVRPILATQCYACHSTVPMGGLRMDSRAALLKGGATGPALVPGDPEKSLLIRAVRQTEALKMPKGGRLAKAEIDTLVEWIRDGAIWPDSGVAVTKTKDFITPERRKFWSFVPLAKPAVPTPRDAAWAKTDIDRFILARLEKENLKPAKAASRRVWLRRAALDLTGLPPTYEETQSFEKDLTPTAYAKVVDRLLASPQYGERWGRLWLDVARYGEDDYRSLDPMRRGYNPYPFAYLYRDWVIKAFNDDLPYDQFIKAQLAADQMDEAVRARMLPALGFLGLGPWYYDNGSVEITHADERNDRVDAVSRGFLGLTAACARCHDHKYDPISQKDYYALAGVFGNAVYHEYPMVPKGVVEEYKKLDKRIENKQKLMGEFMRAESKQLAETLALQSSRYLQAVWRVQGEPKDTVAKVVDEGKLDFELFDRWLKFAAKPPKFYLYLTAWQSMIKSGGTASEAKKLADQFQQLLLDVLFESKELKEENDIIKAKALEGTKPKKRANLPNEFVTNDDFCPGCGLVLKSLAVEKSNLLIDVFERDLADGFDPAQSFEDEIPGLLSFRKWGLERQLSAERRAYIDALRTDIEALKKALPPHYPYVHGVEEAAKPANLQLNLRGNPLMLGDEVPRGFLSVLGPSKPFEKGSGRVELVDEIIRQPITTRVIVNRIWKAHFGTGLVDTPSNFGVAGERPSNPELLEHLAQLFVANGRSIKKLHREIMLSTAYRLGNELLAANFEKDPANRLYWRFDRHRMDAEQIRDSLLHVSGALDPKMGGPSVDLGGTSSRRTVYGKVSRFKLNEYLQLFDFPSPGMSAEKRFTTSVPLQRLFLMNSPFVQQQAELLARRVAAEPDQKARIVKAYSLVFGRTPTLPEIETGVAYLKTEPIKEYDERREAKAKAEKEPAPKAPEKPADKPDEQTDGKKDEKPLPVTIWGRYAKILLSSSEFLFVE